METDLTSSLPIPKEIPFLILRLESNSEVIVYLSGDGFLTSSLKFQYDYFLIISSFFPKPIKADLFERQDGLSKNFELHYLNVKEYLLRLCEDSRFVTGVLFPFKAIVLAERVHELGG